MLLHVRALTLLAHYPPCTLSSLHTILLAHYPPCTLSSLHTTLLAHYPPCTLPSLPTTLLAHYPPCTLPSLHTTLLAHHPPCTPPSLHTILLAHYPPSHYPPCTPPVAPIWTPEPRLLLQVHIWGVYVMEAEQVKAKTCSKMCLCFAIVIGMYWGCKQRRQGRLWH